MTGKMIIFSAPSGSGKTTIVRFLLGEKDSLNFSISATSRQPRRNEIDGKDYYFLSADEFRKKIRADEFVEWEEVYEDTFYGTLKTEVERIWAAGKDVIFDVDVKGGINIKKLYGDKALSVFVMPPSIEELERRLRKRDTNEEDDIAERVAKAEYEMTFAEQFDIILINDELKVAEQEALSLVNSFLR